MSVLKRSWNIEVNVGVFPNPLLRLAGAVLVEIHDEWAVATERRYLSEASMKLITQQHHDPKEVAKPAATA